MNGLPRRFMERMELLLGEEYSEFLASYDKDRVQGLRLNGLKTEEGKRTDLLSFLERELSVQFSKIPWVQEGYYYRGEGRPGKHPLHECGLYYIQEPSAMSVVELLDPQPGDCVLDLCAAPGGKSTQIASRLKGEGFLLSNEIHPARVKILSQNIERMGVGNCVVTNEDSARLEEAFPLFFDKIVIDAPCSGEGMFRKDEEARKQWSEDHVRMCADRQKEILDHGAGMLKPGGRLVYSTCTFAPEENEERMLDFLKEHPEFELQELGEIKGLDRGQPRWCSLPAEETAPYHLERTYRILPHHAEGEGHFIAVLQKKGEAAQTPKLPAPAYLDLKRERESRTLLEEFLKETLVDGGGLLNRGEWILFGDQLYLLPKEMRSLKGLKVLRPGLHVGTLKKNRFEPSHALALWLRPSQAVRRAEFSPDSPEIAAYLRGEAISHAMSGKGWTLITTAGCSLGWAKLTGGILKNHYPKGLRIQG